LQSAVEKFGGNAQSKSLTDYGEIAKNNLQNHSALANRNKPELRSFDRFGNRINEVSFHPSYHKIMTDAIAAGLPSSPWSEPGPGAHVERAAKVYMHCQAEQGTTCPTTMTFSAVPALQVQPDVTSDWIKGVMSREYDPRNMPWKEKNGLTIGMAMTEKQGGSDVRANQSVATAVAGRGPGQVYLLTGHKWFCSAPMSDGFLVLAQTDAGIGCFLMPRWTPEGELNSFQIQRLKDKLGNWSNASSEIEFHQAFSYLLGDEGRGINTILEMVAMTRFDCMIGSSALMRQALAQAMHHCSYRQSFGKTLIKQPSMVSVLADLCIESEAAVLLTLRVAEALDNAICKRTPAMVYECMECLGGSGYVEESVMPQLFRESPLNSIWEGCGNIQSLDVLRALGKSPQTADALLHELDSTKGADKSLDQLVNSLRDDFQNAKFDESSCRQLSANIARAISASLMVRYAPDANAAHYIATRVHSQHGIFGTVPPAKDAAAILQRASPLQAS